MHDIEHAQKLCSSIFHSSKLAKCINVIFYLVHELTNNCNINPFYFTKFQILTLSIHKTIIIVKIPVTHYIILEKKIPIIPHVSFAQSRQSLATKSTERRVLEMEIFSYGFETADCEYISETGTASSNFCLAYLDIRQENALDFTTTTYVNLACNLNIRFDIFFFRFYLDNNTFFEF